MKRIPLLFSFLLVAFFSQAQIDKGTVLLGGDISLYTSKSNPNTATSSQQYNQNQFFIDPSVGLAVAKNLVLGLDLGVGYQSSQNNPDFKDDDYRAGIFLRKYKFLGAGFYFFGATELDLEVDDQTQDQSAGYRQDIRTTSGQLSFAPGVAYALNHRWHLEVVFPQVVDLSYSNQKLVFNIPEQGGSTQNETTQTYRSYGFFTSLSTGFTVRVGARFLIGG